jgi:predicted ribonuclease YlaK
MPRKPAAAKKPAVTKIFVLDTNVLMHDPSCLFRFEEHDVFLPIMTLEELDNHKKGMSEIARNARQTSRMLDELLANNGDIDEGIELYTPPQAGKRPSLPADRSNQRRTAARPAHLQGRQPDPIGGDSPAEKIP